ATAGTQLIAMILLGINAGLGNTDCGTLPLGAINLKSGKLDFPRHRRNSPALLDAVSELLSPSLEAFQSNDFTEWVTFRLQCFQMPYSATSLDKWIDRIA